MKSEEQERPLLNQEIISPPDQGLLSKIKSYFTPKKQQVASSSANNKQKQLNPDQYKYLIKSILLGKQKTGKTSIITKYVKDTFQEKYKQTIGADFMTKITLFDEDIVKHLIWDVSGHERFGNIISSFIRKDIKIIFLVYDCQQAQTFQSLPKTFNQVESNHGALSDSYVCVVSNKNDDILLKCAVSSQQGHEFANKIGAHFKEISAMNKQNCDSLFNDATQWLIKNEKIVGRENPKK